jgi:hypothetical protein
MGPFGHCAVGMAAKRAAPKMPLAVLLAATEILDVFAVAFAFAGIEGRAGAGNPWSHGLIMSVVWSVAAAFLVARIYRSSRAGVIVGLLVFSHWVLDFIPIIRKKAEDNGETEPEEFSTALGFRATYVFDISQTDGQPLPEIGSVNGDPRDCRERLGKFVNEQGIALECTA